VNDALDTGTLSNAPVLGASLEFEDFYVAELGGLVALARALAPAHLAEDIAQEAMLAAYRRWPVVAELERPELWVRRTCSNLAVSQFRRRVVEVRSLARLSLWASTAAAPLAEPSEEFWAAVRSLPRRQAQAVALRYLYDLPVEEIARTMACSVGSVKQHLARGRRRLVERLGLEHEEES
jgi:RNA polymerase sigma-70 factor (ECF subfamily)